MATVLNLGCGHKVHPDCVNIDWSIHLRIARNPLLKLATKAMLSQKRAAYLAGLSENIVVHDLRKGIPYPDQSVDAVYHSHTLEHIDRNLEDPANDDALNFIKECRRVLKPGGVLRVVVPNLENNVRNYLASVERLSTLNGAAPVHEHDKWVHHLIGMAVLREADGSAKQKPALRWIENALLGDARKRGHTHMWEYDRFNLRHLLLQAGFQDIRLVDYATSAIPNWSHYGLDIQDGGEYKPGSFYMEAIR